MHSYSLYRALDVVHAIASRSTDHLRSTSKAAATQQMSDGKPQNGTDRSGPTSSSGAEVPAGAEVTAGAAVAGIVRERLLRQLQAVWERHLAVLTAPAGWGKSTLLGHFAVSERAAVVWYRASGADGTAKDVASRLWSSWQRTGGRPASRSTAAWSSPADVVEALSIPGAGRTLVVIDDFHLLANTEAERFVELLAERAEGNWAIVIATRSEPRLNLSRMRVEGRLVELNADDLRFRTWEVERLFSDAYGARIAPEEAAELARRTGGWAACLQLFRLATAGKPPVMRSRVLASLQGRSRLVREYLTRNVLDELPEDLRTFLVRTCVIAEPTTELCNVFLGRDDAAECLESLRSRHLLLESPDGDGTYHCHEVLRAELDAELVRLLGERGARREHGRAGALLEASAHPTAALQAYLRAGDLPSARRILDEHGQKVAGAPGAWIDMLPANLAASDPWVKVTLARLLAGSGSLADAVETYQSAEELFELGGDSGAAERTRHERRSIESWVDPDPNPPMTPLSIVRSAIRSDPLVAARLAESLVGPVGSLARGLSLCLAGNAVGGGAAALSKTLSDASCPPSIALALAIAGHILAGAGLESTGLVAETTGLITGGTDLDMLLAEMERFGPTWLCRLATAASVLLAGNAGPSADELVAACDADGDSWGHAAVRFLQGAGMLWRMWPGTKPDGSGGTSALRDSAERFEALGAGTLSSIALALDGLSLALTGRAGAEGTVREAGELARRYKSPLAIGICTKAAELLRSPRDGVAEEAHGLEDAAPVPGGTATVTGAGSAAVAVVGTTSLGSDLASELRCLGGFSATIRGRQVDLGCVKPKARKLLAYIAIHAGQPLHRERLVEVFWPAVPLSSGLRNLQVTVSSLRGLATGPSGSELPELIARVGDAYALAPPSLVAVDALRFEELARSAGKSAKSGEIEAARELYEQAASVYRGDLLPEIGPEEWVLEPRERLRLVATDVATGLGKACLGMGDVGAALDAFEWGLSIDRFNDELWRLSSTAHKQAGNDARAARLEAKYQTMLAELGVA